MTCRRRPGRSAQPRDVLGRYAHRPQRQLPSWGFLVLLALVLVFVFTAGR